MSETVLHTLEGGGVYLQEYRCRLCGTRFTATEHRVNTSTHDLTKYARSLSHWDVLHGCPEPYAPRLGAASFVGWVPATAVEYDVADDGELVPVEPDEPDGQSSFVWVPVEKRLPPIGERVPAYRADNVFDAAHWGHSSARTDDVVWEDDAGYELVVTHWADGLEGPG